MRMPDVSGGSKKPAEADGKLRVQLVSNLDYSSTLKMETICCSELHGVISQKTYT
jgi:hypothetical protein